MLGCRPVQGRLEIVDGPSLTVIFGVAHLFDPWVLAVGPCQPLFDELLPCSSLGERYWMHQRRRGSRSRSQRILTLLQLVCHFWRLLAAGLGALFVSIEQLCP